MTQQPNANGRSNGPGRDDDKKLFVGGLGRTISEKELREYFTQYGEIENINIKTDPFSGQSRGFAFVQFVNAKTVDDLLAAGDHFIANKKVDPKRVTKKVNPLRCKIFVGGLTTEMTEQDVRNYFVQFGQISEYQQPFDKMKNQKKGFCFITFEDSEVVNQVLKNPKQVINGKEVDVKKVKFNPETMTAPGTRAGGPVGATRGGAPATFGLRPAYPGYMAPAAASPYGTAADYGYAANAYDAYGAYGGYDYSAIGYGGGGGGGSGGAGAGAGGYPAQAYGGGKYRETTYPRHAPY